MRKTFADLERLECWGFRVGDKVEIYSICFAKILGEGYVIAFDTEYNLVVVSRGTWYTSYHKDLLKIVERDTDFTNKLMKEKTLKGRLILTAGKLLREGRMKKSEIKKLIKNIEKKQDKLLEEYAKLEFYKKLLKEALEE